MNRRRRVCSSLGFDGRHVDRLAALPGRKDKAPLEEVKNVLQAPVQFDKEPHPTLRRVSSAYVTPQNGAPKPVFPLASAMKGVILTASGEALATPTPSELAKFFVASPKASFGFAKIFGDESSGDEDENQPTTAVAAPPRSPAKKRAPVKAVSTGTVSSSSSSSSQGSIQEKPAPATRLRRPSIVRASSSRPKLASESEQVSSKPEPSTSSVKVSSDPPTGATSSRPQTTRTASTPPEPAYDLDDEANLPSPFLKKVERLAPSQSAPTVSGQQAHAPAKKRPSAGNMLRAFAAANNAAGRSKPSAVASVVAAASAGKAGGVGRRAGDESRKALLRT
jgi:hypothetical protein